ncbi:MULTISPECIES: linear amide C-N hydrolase [Enterobacter]|uniref:linear amide C-N hydrolase n=1 Tax=Enterobacter TaxID=547 RepID=UPI0007AE083F|nr:MULTISPECIES: choloylglycine hydrolase family protein [Enterobacter]AMZ77777.1 choloylglycine hydrolase [Enterobacter sp. ODB01]EKS6337608.1 choloylglycine hydrolase family protein [Enterobacter hormaechei]VAL43366.1 Penicillin acylase precursor [Enterobacter kobei]
MTYLLKNKRVSALTAMLFAVVLPGVAMTAPDRADACTSFVLPTTGGAGIYARTMEFEFDMKSALVAIPRHYALKGTGPEGKTAMTWESRYAVIGMNAFGLPSLLDGMNEKGLSGGILYFPGFAQFAPWDEARAAESLAPWDLLTWALTNFSTVAEVKAALENVTVAAVSQKNMGMIPPVHYTLHDSTGASVVIEPVEGRLKIHDNPLGVMTNSPSFDWHMTNLRNYVNLRPENVAPLHIGRATVLPLGTGSGLHGIPGDSSPPSRFVRAAAYVLSVEKVPDGEEGVRMAEHVASNFDMPKGLVQDEKMPPEYTQWTAIADPGTAHYYIKTWDVPVLHGAGFGDFDVDGKNMVTFDLPSEQGIPSLKVLPGAQG